LIIICKGSLYTLFYKNTRLIFAQNLRTISASAEEQSNKTAANTAQLEMCILLYAYSCTTASSQLRENKQKLKIAYLTSWHNSIFGYKLKTIEAKNP